MPSDNHGPFPTAAVIDLLGITRALYRSERAGPLCNGDSIARLAAIGHDFREALELAATCTPGTMGMRAAWTKAERGAVTLGAFVGDTMLIAPAVRAAAARITRR